jgi:anthraniloyl-CoA monooxygenase
VFSDETLGGIEQADAAFYERLSRDFAIWDDIDVHYRGDVITSGGHGFAAISRQRLLAILRERCEEFGVGINYRQLPPPLDELRNSYDLVVAADGANSLTRQSRQNVFRPGRRSSSRRSSSSSPSRTAASFRRTPTHTAMR